MTIASKAIPLFYPLNTLKKMQLIRKAWKKLFSRPESRQVGESKMIIIKSIKETEKYILSV